MHSFIVSLSMLMLVQTVDFLLSYRPVFKFAMYWVEKFGALGEKVSSSHAVESATLLW